MLEELAVTNLGVLKSGRIEPGPGLVVITGETGTGKTLLAGALGLLIGGPSRSGLIGPYGTDAHVEGRFRIDDTELVVSRRLLDGRSRAYRNGEMVPLRALADEGGNVVEMIAQHDHLTIGTESSIIALVDRLLDKKGLTAREVYVRAWEALVEVRARSLDGDIRSIERARDLAVHESSEIADAGFAVGDDEQLHRDLSRRRNAVELTEHLSTAHAGLTKAQDDLAIAVDELRKAGRFDESIADLAERTQGEGAEVLDVAATVRSALDGVDHDPVYLAAQEDRLARLADLRRKYGDTLDEVLAYGVAAQARAAEFNEKLTAAASFSDDLAQAEATASETGEQLQAARRVAAKKLCVTAIAHLEELGFSSPHLSVAFEPSAYRSVGASHLSLWFASDDRLAPGPVNKVASGGELSRLVLALRLAGGVGAAPVVVFDEIDAGVGGRTALALGRKLAGLAEQRQVFVVTHLPQVAAFADTHYVVDRDEEGATVREVNGDERIDEIARMLAGLDDSQQGRGHAAELVAAARQR